MAGILKNAPVSENLARLLKGQGFDWPTTEAYCIGVTEGTKNISGLQTGLPEVPHNTTTNEFFEHISAPRISLVQRWFLEEKGIYIIPMPSENGKWHCTILTLATGLKRNLWCSVDTYDDAMISGIEYLLLT